MGYYRQEKVLSPLLLGKQRRASRAIVADRAKGKARRMNRADYERYLMAFNAKDYDGVCDFYAEPMDMDFFGISIRVCANAARGKLQSVSNIAAAANFLYIGCLFIFSSGQ